MAVLSGNQKLIGHQHAIDINNLTYRHISGPNWEQVLKLDDINKVSSKGFISGDSTIAEYLGQNAVALYILSSGDRLDGTTIADISVPGHTILQQQALYTADPNKATYDWHIVEIGLNDVLPSEDASIAMARYQTYINLINANRKAGSKLIIGTMTPCRQRLIDIYGPVDGVTSYNKWLKMNESIMGGGDYPILGVDSRINQHTFTINDGDGNLAPIYEVVEMDHVHENNLARGIIGSVYRLQLARYGFLKTTNSGNIMDYRIEGLRVNTPILGNLIGDVSGFAYSENLQTITERSNRTIQSIFIEAAEGIPTTSEGMTLYYAGNTSTVLSYKYAAPAGYRPLHLDASLVTTNCPLVVTGKATVTGTPTALNDVVRYTDLGTGWVSVKDTFYTVGAPYSINNGITANLQNNANVLINNQASIGVISWYNNITYKITPQLLGDYYILTVRFKAKNTAPSGGFIDFGIDLGGATGVVFKESKAFLKASGIEQDFVFVCPAYVGADFLANGGLVKVTAGGGTVTIYNIEYQINRVHKAK